MIFLYPNFDILFGNGFAVPRARISSQVGSRREKTGAIDLHRVRFLQQFEVCLVEGRRERNGNASDRT